jgi:raffinose/stachyose/melibiose transport system substrate-binding protein
MPTYEKLGLEIPQTWDAFMKNNDEIKKAGIAPRQIQGRRLLPHPWQDAAAFGMTVWPGNGLYIPKTVEGEKLDAAKKFVEFMTTQQGCDAYAKGTAPTGPFLTSNCTLPSDVSQVAKDTQSYIESGKASPALEFKSPIKGPALEQICIQVGTGQASAEEGAALYDEDVKKQAQQLGLPGWD